MLSLLAVEAEAEAAAEEDDIIRKDVVAKACAGRMVCRKASSGSTKGSRRGRRCRLEEGEDHMRCVFCVLVGDGGGLVWWGRQWGGGY